MPLNTDSYSTTIGSSIDTRSIQAAIREAVITDDLDTQRVSTQGLRPFGGFHPLFITETFPSEGKIPNFPHPILIKGIRSKNFICSDLRLVLRANKGEEFQTRIKNHQEYDFVMNRHKLETFWAGGRAAEFRTGLRFGAYSFAVWLSNAIGHLKGLDEYQRQVCQVILMCYYADLSHEEEDFKEHLYRTSMIPWIEGIVPHTLKFMDEIVLQVGKEPMRNLADAIDRIKKVLDSPLLVNLNEGTLTTSIKSHWWGHGVEPQRIIGVAVEDPPTWCALVQSALTYSGYKNSQIAQTVTKLGKKGEAEAFSSTITGILNEQLRMESIADHVDALPEDNRSDYEINELVLRAEATPDFSNMITKKE